MAAERIRVDANELLDLSTQIQELASNVRHADAHLGAAGYSVESRRIESALDNFSRDWSDRRNELADLLGSAQEILRVAAENFQLVDNQLAQGMQGGQSSGEVTS